jgi:hypothetical protein
MYLGTGFPFVASYDSQGLWWRYSNPPPHGLLKVKVKVTLRLTASQSVSQSVSQYVLMSSPFWFT